MKYYSKALLLLVMLLVATSLQAASANIYVSLNGAGTQDGLSAANAKPLSFFNNAANWGAGAGQIGPDTVVHLVGTFTFGAGSQKQIAVQGNGTSGHPITILWEPGAVVQAPYFTNFNNDGGVTTNGHSFITFDGGTNGIIQNTACGTGLAFAGPCGGGQPGQGTILLSANGGTNVTVKNLHLINSYVHTRGTFTGYNTYDIFFIGVSNITLQGNTLTWAEVGFQYAWNTGNANLIVTGNNFSNINQNMQLGPNGCGQRINNIRVDHNVGYFYGVWDDGTAPGGSSGFHHNFFHPFTGAGPGCDGHMDGVNQVYDNTLGGPGALGDLGNFPTSFMFIEVNNGGGAGTSAPWYIFNNAMEKSSISATSSGLIDNFAPGCVIVNNTIKDAGGSGGNAFPGINLYGGSDCTVKNNVFVGNGYYIYDQAQARNINNNVYFGSANDVPWIWGGSGFTGSFTNWKSLCACDANSTTANPLLNANLSLQAGSSAINAGANLTLLGVPALNSDINGVLRSATGNWDIGAFAFGGGTAPPAIAIAPSPISFTDQVQNTSSAPQTITITNTSGGAALVLSASFLTISGTNGADWTRSGGTCANNQSIPSGGNCTVGLVFRPVTIGNETGQLQINSNASNPAASTAALSGRGILATTNIISSAPATVTFPSTTVGVTAASQNVTITVTGTAAQTMANPPASLTGTNAADYKILPGPPTLVRFTACPSQAFTGSCTIPATVAGDMLVVGYTSNNGFGAATITSMTDNAADTFTQVAGARSLNAVPNTAADLWTAVGRGGATLLTVNTSVAVTGELGVWEVAGVNAVDVACLASDQAASATPSSCALVTTKGAEFLVSITDFQGAISGMNGGNLFTSDSVQQGNGYAHYAPLATGTFTAQWAGSSGTFNNSGVALYSTTGNAGTCAPGLVVAAGGTCTEAVAFTPGAAGTRTATITSRSTVGATASSALTGTGAATATCLSIAPTPVLFGTVIQGQTSASTSATVTNCGTGSVTLASPKSVIVMISPVAQDFTDLLTGDCTNGKVLASNATCLINMSFTPTTSGAESATLTVNGSGSATANTTLSGTGTVQPGTPASLPWIFTLNGCINYSPARTRCQMSLPAAAVLLPGLTKGRHVMTMDGGFEIEVNVQ